MPEAATEFGRRLYCPPPLLCIACKDMFMCVALLCNCHVAIPVSWPMQFGLFQETLAAVLLQRQRHVYTVAARYVHTETTKR
jgi:hypothetical protein